MPPCTRYLKGTTSDGYSRKKKDFSHSLRMKVLFGLGNSLGIILSCKVHDLLFDEKNHTVNVSNLTVQFGFNRYFGVTLGIVGKQTCSLSDLDRVDSNTRTINPHRCSISLDRVHGLINSVKIQQRTGLMESWNENRPHIVSQNKWVNHTYLHNVSNLNDDLEI